MRKLTKKGQMLIYAAGGMGVNLLNTIMGSYLCSALLIGAFGEKDIPFQTYAQKDLVIPALWAVFALAAKIIDGVIDIPMAALTDSLRSKWGRRRPAILIGLIVMAASYALFTVIPNPSGATVLNTIYYGVMLAIFYSSYTLTMVTYYATFTEIVDKEKDRDFISNVKAFCDIVYFTVGYVAVRAILNSANIRPVALMMLPACLTMLIPIFLIKEESTLGVVTKIKMLSLVDSFKAVIKNKAFVVWMIVYSLMTFGVQLFLAGINEFFSFVGLNMVVVMCSSFAPVPFTFILYDKILRKKGFGFAFKYAMVMYSAGMIGLCGVGFMAQGVTKTIGAIICGILCAFAVGSIFAMAYSIPSQIAAEEQEKTKVANSAMYFAIQGLFSGVASGIASGVVLTALKGSETAHSEAIRYMTLIAGLATLAAGVLSFVLPKSINNIGKNEH